MEPILLMLKGKMSMKEFLFLLQNDPEVQKAVRELVPKEAKFNSEHPVWKFTNYASFKDVDFDLFLWIKKHFRFTSDMGNSLNIFGILQVFVKCADPDFEFTDKYEAEFNCYLDIVGETYEGPEVEALLEEIVRKSMSIQKKKERIQISKREIKEIFHIENGKRPHWINGGEWPMGTHSPMKFIRQESRIKTEDRVLYYFQDVDTNEVRIISQYY